LTLRTVIKNAGWLGLTQVINYLIPVLTLPVVTRAFGTSLFGILSALTAYAGYIGIFTGYGTYVTGPRAIAGLRADAQMLSKAVSAIIGVQLSLGLAAFSVFSAGIGLVPHANEYRLVGLVVLIQMFATAAAPQWVFVGLEQTRDFAFVQLMCRVPAAILVICAVRSPDDLLLYVSINCFCALCILVFSLIGLTWYSIRWQIPSIPQLVLTIRQATRLFFSSVAISIYTTTNVVIVALVLGPSAAGAFALADRVCLATGGIIGPVTQALYPFVCRMAGREETHREAWEKRIFFGGIVVLSISISLALFTLAPLIVLMLGGPAFHDAIPVLRIIAVLPVIIALSNIFGMQTMLPLHMDREFTLVVASAAVISVAAMFVLTRGFGLPGAALTMIAVETYVTVAFVMNVQRRINVLSLFFKLS
jgi:PST family polysaccharide transporter